MIIKTQISELSEIFQIDEYTIFREYLQLLFLSYLYQENKSDGIVFKGGTALRLIFGSPRFSEDLDFSTPYSDEEIRNLLEKIEINVARELTGLEITQIYSGKEGVRFKIKYESTDFKYPLSIRLDFHKISDLGQREISTLSTRLPLMIFPQIIHLSAEDIFKEKLMALAGRSKGRDIFDIWFLLQKGVVTPGEFDKSKVVKRIKLFSEGDLNKDLGKFLPRGQKGIIPKLKEEIIRLFLEK